MDEGVKMPKFDGTDAVEFSRYASKLLAIGPVKGDWHEALLADLPIAATAAQTAAAAAALAVQQAQGGQAPPAGPATTVYQDNQKKRNVAWSYLIMTLENAPLHL